MALTDDPKQAAEETPPTGDPESEAPEPTPDDPTEEESKEAATQTGMDGVEQRPEEVVVHLYDYTSPVFQRTIFQAPIPSRTLCKRDLTAKALWIHGEVPPGVAFTTRLCKQCRKRSEELKAEKP